MDRVQAGVWAQLGLAYETVTITYLMFYCKEFYNLLGEVIFFYFFYGCKIFYIGNLNLNLISFYRKLKILHKEVRTS